MTLTWLSQHLDLGEASRAELKRIIADAQVRGDVMSELRGYARTGGIEYDYGALAEAQAAYLERSPAGPRDRPTLDDVRDQRADAGRRRWP